MGKGEGDPGALTNAPPGGKPTDIVLITPRLKKYTWIIPLFSLFPRAEISIARNTAALFPRPLPRIVTR